MRAYRGTDPQRDSGGGERNEAVVTVRSFVLMERLLSFGVEWWLSEQRSLHTGAASSIFN